MVGLLVGEVLVVVGLAIGASDIDLERVPGMRWVGRVWDRIALGFGWLLDRISDLARWPR